MGPHKTDTPSTRGVLITFEGIDGTGKSTQLHLLSRELERMGYAVVTTREPTDGPFGLRIRQLYMNRATVSPEQELDLFLADRKQHVEEIIAPALASGKIVLTDRYYLSTAAYQGIAGLDPAEIIKRNEDFAPIPDLALLFIVPPRLGIERIQTLRHEKLNDFEQESELLRVAEVFNSLKYDYIKRVDGGQSIEDVHRAVLDQVRLLLDTRDFSGR